MEAACSGRSLFIGGCLGVGMGWSVLSKRCASFYVLSFSFQVLGVKGRCIHRCSGSRFTPFSWFGIRFALRFGFMF